MDNESDRAIFNAGVTQFLEHVRDDFSEGEIGAIAICAELHLIDDEGESYTLPMYWCSNENKIYHRGFFELLADYTRINGGEFNPHGE